MVGQNIRIKFKKILVGDKREDIGAQRDRSMNNWVSEGFVFTMENNLELLYAIILELVYANYCIPDNFCLRK